MKIKTLKKDINECEDKVKNILLDLHKKYPDFNFDLYVDKQYFSATDDVKYLTVFDVTIKAETI